MKFRRLLAAPLLAAGAVAAIAVAPVASAAPSQPNCVYSGPGNSLCESGGSAAIVATPNNVRQPEWGPYPFGYGGLGGYGYYGGLVLNGHHHHR